MYDYNDIQKMLENLNNNNNLLKAYCKELESINATDRMAIMSVIKECWYEEFDRYDSDVCEQFIILYEKCLTK